MKPPTLDQLRAGMAPIAATIPTDHDRALYRLHGYQGLKARGMYSVLDRFKDQPATQSTGLNGACTELIALVVGAHPDHGYLPDNAETRQILYRIRKLVSQ